MHSDVLNVFSFSDCAYMTFPQTSKKEQFIYRLSRSQTSFIWVNKRPSLLQQWKGTSSHLFGIYKAQAILNWHSFFGGPLSVPLHTCQCVDHSRKPVITYRWERRQFSSHLSLRKKSEPALIDSFFLSLLKQRELRNNDKW